eukprot:s863_g12.t1
MAPKAKAVTKERKEKQKGYEGNRPKRKQVSLAEYETLTLARERVQMFENDSNVMYRREEEPDREEGLKMEIEDLRSRLYAADSERQRLHTQVLRLKLRELALFSARGSRGASAR